MWYVYILRSKKDGDFYIGCTKNLKRRIREHNKGYTASTKNRIPFELIHKEVYDVRVNAYTREREIKDMKGGVAFKELLNKH